MDLVDEIRTACAGVARRAQFVAVDEERIPSYARTLPRATPAGDDLIAGDSLEERAAFVCALDAINFGSGWFPTLRKRPGRSGYFTVALGLRHRFTDGGPWSAAELAQVEASQVAAWLGQDPEELMALFAAALRELGERVAAEHDGRFLALARSEPSAVGLVQRMATWPTWSDASLHDGELVPFLKRAQILAADLVRAGVADFPDLHRLTLFADNLVPHVLRLDGILGFDPALVERVERGELLEHGSPEEVEIRACALHAVELLATARPGGASPYELDLVLWGRGQQPHYKEKRRHRSPCTAY